MAYLPPRRRQWSTDEERKLIALRAEGKSWNEIARELGRTQLSVEVRHAQIKEKQKTDRS
jgi:DNA-binding NarL/FixJ family response regulator